MEKLFELLGLIVVPIFVAWFTSWLVIKHEVRTKLLENYEHDAAREYHSIRSRYIGVVSAVMTPTFIHYAGLSGELAYEIQKLGIQLCESLSKVMTGSHAEKYFNIPSYEKAHGNVRFVTGMISGLFAILEKNFQAAPIDVSTYANDVREDVIDLLNKSLYQSGRDKMDEDYTKQIKEIFNKVGFQELGKISS